MSDIQNTMPLVCPHCGFRVFNRRYPKCESCGQSLPEGLVYSNIERAELQKKDEDDGARARLRNGRPPGDAGGGFGFTWGIGDTGSGNDCGGGGGDCGGGGGGD